MKKQALEKYLSSFKGAEASHPFGPEALVFKVAGKMFALVSQLENPPRVTLKVVPDDGEVLVGQFASVTPGYYMDKRHWITVTLPSGLPKGMLKSLSADSYRLVVAKLSKKERALLEEK